MKSGDEIKFFNPNFKIVMEENIKVALEKISNLTEKNHKMLKSIKRHIIFERIFGILKILIILIPIILGVIYLPTIFEKIAVQYGELINFSANPAGINAEDLKSLLSPEILKDLENKIQK